MDTKQKKSRAARGLGKEPFQGEEETEWLEGVKPFSFPPLRMSVH